MSDYPTEVEAGWTASGAPLVEPFTGGGWGGAEQQAFDPATGELVGEPYAEPQQPDPLGTATEVAALPAVFAQQGARAVQLFRDPDAVQTLTHEATKGLLARLEGIAADARAQRAEGRVTPSVLAPELTLMGDAHDTLQALEAVFHAGRERARAIAGELVHELPGDDTRQSTSVKVGDAHGTDLKVTRTQPTKVHVDQDELVDVFVSLLLGRWEADRRGLPEVPLTSVDTARAYSMGARAAIDLYRAHTAAHTFKTTALDELTRVLEGEGQDALAIRLGHAYGRASHGDPQVKMERATRKATIAGTEQPDGQ